MEERKREYTGGRKKKSPLLALSHPGWIDGCRRWRRLLWLNQLQQTHHTLSITEAPSLRFKLNPPWPIGCPLARLYADSLRHVPKGCAETHTHTSFFSFSWNRVCWSFSRNTDAWLFFPTIWCPMRGGVRKTTARFSLPLFPFFFFTKKTRRRTS